MRYTYIMPMLIFGSILLSPVMFAGVPNESTVKIVIITGVDHKLHIWQETAPALQEIIARNKGFQVTIVEDPNFLASDELFTYDAIAMNFKNYDPLDNEAQAQHNLIRFMEQGGGLVSVHFASGAFDKWIEYRNIVGRKQIIRHDKRGPFTVKITDHQHPVTRGLHDYEADDELFIDLVGRKPITVLATAHSKLDGYEHPMAFVHTYKGGRVFHTTLGHDARALRISGTAGLIQRGAAWVVHKDPDAIEE